MQARPDIRTDSQAQPRSGFMRRLRRHQGGNVLPIMAMAIIPLAGLVGGGVDMSRMYLAKARLQQACDAGALAGRKVMGGGSWSANSNAANTAALQFFDGNFANGAYGTTGRSRSFAESNGKVTGTASVTVPMSVMKVFGVTPRTINVICDAEMSLPNTDVMFVLDVTGSMNDPLDGTAKIVTLKKAVKCFYETVARLDIDDADCGSTPSGGVSAGTQIRFGFVPYSTNVNVGKLLKPEWVADNWTYQSRERVFQGYTNNSNSDWSSDGSWSSWSSWTVHSTTNNVNDSDDCDAPVTDNSYSPNPPTTMTSTTDSYGTITTTSTGTFTQTQTEYDDDYDSDANVCVIEKRTRTRNRTGTRTQTSTPDYTWRYAPISHPVNALKNGTGWYNSLVRPVGHDDDRRGIDATITWDGCIEERKTERLTSYDPIPSTVKDLNIDLVPSSGDPESLWAPALPGLVFTRGSDDNDAAGSFIYASFESDENNYANPNYVCPTPAKKLQAWSTASDYKTYVNSLTPGGNTYHDIGMIWGARFMSPTGIFASENATTQYGGDIQRHMIFMTDGQTCTSNTNYAAYGLAWFDRRQTPIDSAPTDGCSDASSNGGTLSQQVDARFPALCTAVKNKNITLWVIYFGTTDATTTARMTACATPGRFYSATNSAALISTFASIANQISQLRLTQ